MTSRNISRRGFLQTAGAGAVTVWVPTRASGYTAAEMRAMAADDTLPGVGVSKWELDTPALCVDLDKLEQNLATMKAKLNRIPTANPASAPASAMRRICPLRMPRN